MGLRSGDCGGCMSRVTWHVILLEATFRKLEHCGYKGMNMVSRNTQKKKAQLVLRSPKCTKTRKYPPLHWTTTIYFCVPLVGSHSWFLPVYLNVIQQWPALLPFCFHASVLLSIIVRSLRYNLKHLVMIVVLMWCHMYWIELNWISVCWIFWTYLPKSLCCCW